MLFKKLWQKRQSVALTWLASYLTILFVPIVVSVFVYQASSHTLDSEIVQANDSLLKQVREVIDNEFVNIVRLDTQLKLDPSIQNLMYTDQGSDHNYSFYVYQIAQRLSFYQSSYPSVDQFYIYWNKQDSVLIPNAVETSQIAYQSFHQKGNLSYDQWHSLVRNSSVNGFVTMQHLALDGTVHPAIAYTSTFIPVSGNAPVGKIVILVDDSRILQAIQNVTTFNGGDVFILNKENQVLLSTSNNSPSLQVQNQQLSGTIAQFFGKYKGQQAEYFMIRSANSELKYVTVIPSQIVWNKAVYVRNLTVLSILISILGGGILTYFFWRRNYNPLSRLVESLNKYANQAGEKHLNEYHVIQQAIASALDENAQIQLRLNQQNQLLRAHLISKMIKGTLDSQVPLEEALTTYDIQFRTDYFAVLLFQAEALGERLHSIGRIEHKAQQDLIQFVASNVLEAMIAQHHQVLVTEMDDMTACLVNFSHEASEQDNDRLLEFVQATREFLIKQYSVDLTVSVSTVHKTIFGIPTAYREALEAMEYKLVMGGQEILSYAEIQKQFLSAQNIGYYYPLEAEQKLINFIKSSEFLQGEQLLQQILEQNLQQSKLSIQLAKCLIFNLVSTMIKALNDMGDIQDNLLLRKPKVVEQLLSSETLQDMQVHLVSMLKEVCEYTAAKQKNAQQSERKSSVRQLCEDVLAFIETEYSNVNLNISMIAENFGITPTYLSKLFKEQIGEGLLDCINKVRIARAKHLIVNENLSVQAVSVQVGFQEVNSFIRIFKKYEGITPGKYKQIV